MTSPPVPDVITQVDRSGAYTNQGPKRASLNVQSPDTHNRDHQSLFQRLMCCFVPQWSPPLHEPVPIGASEALLPPPSEDQEQRICLLLDLDETLVHSSFQKVPNSDYEVPITIENQKYNVFVRKRPFVDDFLEEMGKHFEVVIFTASLPKYADPVLDILDPKGIIQHRLFRNNCTFSGGGFVKDLSRVGRTLNRTLIIDNSAPAFAFHPNHSILIESFFDDSSDTELCKLTPFLVKLSQCKDVRPLLKQWKEGKRSDFT